jgi:hypothetical protein
MISLHGIFRHSKDGEKNKNGYKIVHNLCTDIFKQNNSGGANSYSCVLSAAMQYSQKEISSYAQLCSLLSLSCPFDQRIFEFVIVPWTDDSTQPQWSLKWTGGDSTPRRCNNCHIFMFEGRVQPGRPHVCVFARCDEFRYCMCWTWRGTNFALFCLDLPFSFFLITFLDASDLHAAEFQARKVERQARIKRQKEQDLKKKEEEKERKRNQKLECLIDSGHLGTLRNNAGDDVTRTAFNSAVTKLRAVCDESDVTDLTHLPAEAKNSDRNPMFSVRNCAPSHSFLNQRKILTQSI